MSPVLSLIGNREVGCQDSGDISLRATSCVLNNRALECLQVQVQVYIYTYIIYIYVRGSGNVLFLMVPELVILNRII